MLRQQRDFILRLVEQAAIALARLRERLASDAQPDEIVQAARAAQGELLGKDAGLLRALDPASAKHVLGDADRIPVWVELLRVEAAALRKSGEEEEASALEQRAELLSRKSE